MYLLLAYRPLRDISLYPLFSNTFYQGYQAGIQSLRGATFVRVLYEGRLRGFFVRGWYKQHKGKEFMRFLALLFFFHYDNCATNNHWKEIYEYYHRIIKLGRFGYLYIRYQNRRSKKNHNCWNASFHSLLSSVRFPNAFTRSKTKKNKSSHSTRHLWMCSASKTATLEMYKSLMQLLF